MFEEFSRTLMLIGQENIFKLKKSKVAVFGIGGVGSYVVEGLVRVGVGNIVLIDDDIISKSNINRQIHALYSSIGRPKVEIMKERVLDINPEINLDAYQKLYNSNNAKELLLDDYTYVVDAIDMVSSKIDLIQRCKEKKIEIISCMGTGNRLDPTLLKIDDIYNTQNCPLARIMRKELKKRKIEDLDVVYSTEKPIKPKTDILLSEHRQSNKRGRIIGSVSFVPSVAGLIIASEVVKNIINNK